MYLVILNAPTKPFLSASKKGEMDMFCYDSISSTCKCHCALAISCEALGRGGWWTLPGQTLHMTKITTSPHPGPQLDPHLVVKVGQAQKIGPELNDHSAGFFPKKKPGWIGWYSHQPPKENLETSVITMREVLAGNHVHWNFEQMNSIVAWCLDFLLRI